MSTLIDPGYLRDCLNNPAQSLLRLQPIYQLEGGIPAKHETLLRLIDKRGGEILPKDFLPVAAREGLLPQIDMMVLEQFKAHFHPDRNPPPSRIALNVTRRTIHNEAYCKRLLADDWRPLLNRVVLEVKSADLVRDDMAYHILRSFKADGAKLSIDYPGGGPPMARLTAQLGFDYLKMDVNALVESPTDRTTISDTCAAAVDCGLDVVFERIETAQSLALAHDMRATLVQGFLLGMPQFEYSTDPLASTLAHPA